MIIVLFKHDTMTALPNLSSDGSISSSVYSFLLFILVTQPLAGFIYRQARLLFLYRQLFWSQVFLLNCSVGCLYVFWFPQFSHTLELIGAEAKEWRLSLQWGINATSSLQSPGSSECTFLRSASHPRGSLLAPWRRAYTPLSLGSCCTISHIECAINTFFK